MWTDDKTPGCKYDTVDCTNCGGCVRHLVCPSCGETDFWSERDYGWHLAACVRYK